MDELMGIAPSHYNSTMKPKEDEAKDKVDAKDE